MEPSSKRSKLENANDDVAVAAATNTANEVFPLEYLPAEIFPSLAVSLSHKDIVHLSEVHINPFICSNAFFEASSAFSWLVDDNTWCSSVWGQLLRSEFRLTDVNGFQMPPRHIYIQLKRAFWSPVGIPWPGCAQKDVKHDPYIKEYCRLNHIKPFWMQHLGHTNQRTRRLAAEVKSNNKSRFRSAVLHCLEVNRIQIEGEIHVRFPGYYRVEWSLLLQNYALKTPIFTSRVVGPNQQHRSDTVYDQKFSWDLNEPNTPSFYKWIWEAGEIEPQRGADQALPVGDFFEVIVGKVRVDHPNSKILVTMVEPGLEWKYDFFVDYVALVPITKEQFDTLEIVSPNRDLPPLPAPVPPAQAAAAQQQQQQQQQNQGQIPAAPPAAGVAAQAAIHNAPPLPAAVPAQ